MNPLALRVSMSCIVPPLWTALLAGSLIAVPPLPAGASPRSDQASRERASPAKEAFERLKAFHGSWVGKSTRGWEEVITFKTIAQGSAVHESSFDAHPNETMATMYYLDGDRLLLTHYCVSQTQPRLRAEAFEEGGRRVTFVFVDGGNMESRDKGHMDKVVIRFIDDDHFTAQWTWYQNGKERWLEEVRYERSPSRSAGPPK